MRLRFVLLTCAILSFGFADTLTLRNGKVVQGEYLGGDSRHVRMAVEDKIVTYDVTEISSLQFGTAAAAEPAASTQLKSRPQILRPEQPAGVSEQVKTASSSASAIDVPAGTSLVVRMIDPVDSEVNHLGDTFKASIDEPVVVNGNTVIPRGADVVVKLVQDKQSGKIAGRTELTLDLVSVKVNGKDVDVNTQDVTTASKSRTERSAAVIGGTAALGAIIGAIAGGGKGAAVGAVSGAGAGTAVQVLTKGQKVKIPAETRLEFILQQALKV